MDGQNKEHDLLSHEMFLHIKDEEVLSDKKLKSTSYGRNNSWL